MSIIVIKSNEAKVGFEFDRRQEFLLDSADDLYNLPLDCMPGSKAYLVDNSRCWMMGSEFEWVECVMTTGGSGSVPADVLRYTYQVLNSDQKSQARENIGAADANEVERLSKEVNNISDPPDVSAFITRAVNDLENYYRKDETYTREEIDGRISAIPKFSIAVVYVLPTDVISETTIYLVPGGVDGNLYTEYIYVNGTWEILGSQRVDLTGYATQTWTLQQLAGYQPKGNYLTEHQDISGKLDANKLPEAVNTALAQAKASGEFDGKDGISPTVAVSTITGGHRITITDKNGTKTVDVMDGEKGDSGRGIAAIARTSGSGAAGTTDTYTITYTDGTTSTFSVYNGKNGTNGTSVTVKSVSESTADGGSNIVTFSDGETLTVKNGSKGSPVRGVDYYTEADQEDIVQRVLTELGAIPVYGTIDDNNNIYLTAMLQNGTYYLKYADADGNVTDICTYVHNYVPAPSYKNLFVLDTAQLNKRTNSNGNVSDNTGCFLTDFIDLGNAMASGGTNVLHYKGMYFNTDKWTSSYEIYSYVCYYDADKRFIANDNHRATKDVLSADGDYTLTLANRPTARYIRITASVLPNPSSATAIAALTSKDQLADVKIALNEAITD